VITAVDTNVLLDVFGADESYGEMSAATVRSCSGEGSLIVCDVVWAELASVFPGQDEAAAALGLLHVDFSALEREAASHAGDIWREYRRRGGARTRLVADFLVGAHAARQADRLLTRDRGFYRSYFGDLEIVDPTERR
jgi:predicted nucleic acid-binding protein